MPLDMSTSTTPRNRLTTWAGMAAVAAPLLALFAIASGIPLYTMDMADAASTNRLLIANGATLGVFLLVVYALVGVHAHVQARLTTAGQLGFVVALIGTVLAAGGAWDSLFAQPYIADAAPVVLDDPTGGTLLAGFLVSYLVLAIGWTTYAIALLRARVLPTAATVTMLVGALIAIAPAPTAIRVLPIAVGVALAGRSVLRDG